MRARDGFVLDLDAIPADDARRARVLIVNYPNNPDRRARGARFLRARGRRSRAQHDLLLVSDLAYSELTYDGRRRRVRFRSMVRRT